MTKKAQFNTVGEAIAAREARLAAERAEREAQLASNPAPKETEVSKRHDRVRHGKTERDRANGAHQRNAARKAARAEWQRNASKTNPGPFPV